MKIKNIEFSNIFCASGSLNFFGQGWWYHYFLKLIFGLFGFNLKGISLKTKTTPFLKRNGNLKLNRFFQPKFLFSNCVKINFFKGFILNAIDLSSPGLLALLEKNRWQKLKENFVISIATVEKTKNKRINEINNICYLLRTYVIKFSSYFALELNISCPNTGLNFNKLFLEVEEILIILRKLHLPIILKINALIPPVLIKELERKNLFDVLCVSNSIPFGEIYGKIFWQNLFGKKISPLAKFGGGGLSGKPIKKIVLEWIEIARAIGVNCNIIGGGGILSSKDVIEYNGAGANAIEIGSVIILRPWRIKSIIKTANSLKWRVS